MDHKAFYDIAERYFLDHQEEMLELLCEFCRVPSVSRADLAQPNAPFGPECRRMLDLVLERAREMGFDTEDMEGYCGLANYGENPERIAVLAHVDVVPAGDSWIYPAFEPTRKGDFLIGRGVVDDKAAAIMGLYSMKFFKDQGIELKHGLQTYFGCSEETGMDDMSYYSAHRAAPKLSLVADSDFPVNYAQKAALDGLVDIELGDDIVEFVGGEVPNMVPPKASALVKNVNIDVLKAAVAGKNIEVIDEGPAHRITATGMASHASMPQDGVSAINMLAELLAEVLPEGRSKATAAAIRDLTCDYYGEKYGIAHEDPDTGKTTMCVGVAKTCEGRVSLTIDCRLSITADRLANVDSMTAAAKALGFNVLEMVSQPHMFIPKDDPRVTILTDIYNGVTGDNARPYTSGGGTYSRCLENAITFGHEFPAPQPRPDDLPASHGSVHSPDEFLYIPNLIKGCALYACAIKALDGII